MKKCERIGNLLIGEKQYARSEKMSSMLNTSSTSAACRPKGYTGQYPNHGRSRYPDKPQSRKDKKNKKLIVLSFRPNGRIR